MRLGSALRFLTRVAPSRKKARMGIRGIDKPLRSPRRAPQRRLTMGRRTLTLLTVGFLLAADSPVKQVEQEMKKFQGTWVVARARRDGEVDAELAGATVTLAGNMFTSKSGKTILAQGTWKVDPAKKPKTIDIEYTDGPEKGQTA